MSLARRLLPLVAVVALSLVLLRRPSLVRAWAAGADDGVRALAGGAAPELPAGTRALDGAPLSLAALRGQVVLLHFWTFGCSNCKHMLPHYADWAARFGPRGLRVVGVHTPELDFERERAALARFVHDERIRWPVIPDDDHAIWSRYRVAAWPTMVIIDRGGVVRASFVGDDQAAAVEAELVRRLRP